VNDDPCLPRALGRVTELDGEQLARARRAVLARVDFPAADPRRLDRPVALDVLAMLGLVDDPRPTRRRRRG
jgi:hypothetical protein